MKKKLLFAVCFFVAVCFCMSVAGIANASSLFNDYQTVYCYPNLIENKTSDVDVLPFKYFNCISEVIFEPWISGTWKLSLIGKNPWWYQQASGAVQVAWKDYNGDRKWHVFTEKNVIYGVFTNIILYSGTKSITYRIRFANQCDVGGAISATPLFMY